MSKYTEEFEKFADKCYKEHGIDVGNDMIESKLEHECNKITIIFPTLEDLVPVMELAPGEKCPHGLDGKCNGCPHFVCYKGSEIFAFMHYTAYCDKEEGDQADGQQTGDSKEAKS